MGASLFTPAGEPIFKLSRNYLCLTILNNGNYLLPVSPAAISHVTAYTRWQARHWKCNLKKETIVFPLYIFIIKLEAIHHHRHHHPLVFFFHLARGEGEGVGHTYSEEQGHRFLFLDHVHFVDCRKFLLLLSTHLRVYPFCWSLLLLVSGCGGGGGGGGGAPLY